MDRIRSRAKLAWIIPLCCLILTPMLEVISLLAGIGLGFTFLVIALLDLRRLAGNETRFHILTGSALTMA